MSQGENTSVPSPFATGGGGTFFEQQVGAMWLSLLLTRAIPPVIVDTQVSKVSFQTSNLGWHTDDFLVEGTKANGTIRRLAGQVKSSFTVSSKNADFNKTVPALWKDFNSNHFNQQTDRLAIVVKRGSNVLLEHLTALFDCAATSNSSEEFNRRLNTAGMLDKNVRHYAEEIKKSIEAADLTFDQESFWKFLKSLVVLSLDLQSNSKQTEAWIKSLLAQTASGLNKAEIADQSWTELLAIASQAMPQAKTISYEVLPVNLRQRHSPISSNDQSALATLKEQSQTILNSLSETIGGKVHLEREQLTSQILEAISTQKIVVIQAPAGAGKSSAAKKLISKLSDRYFCFAFRAEQLATPHLNETLSNCQVNLTGERLGALLCAQSEKIVLIDSAERLLEKSVRDGFADLLKLIARDDSWRVIVTCRSYSVEQVTTSFLSGTFKLISVPELSDSELKTVETAIPELSKPLANQRLAKILKNPFVLDKAAKMKWKEDQVFPQTERDFRNQFWKDIVRNESIVTDAFPSRRDQALEELAIRRAKALSLFAGTSNIDPGALQKLHQDNLIIFSNEGDSFAAPAHDVIEDWTLIRAINKKFTEFEGRPVELNDFIKTYPALRRAYRMWLQELCEVDAGAADIYVQNVLKNEQLPAQFRDDTIVSILRSKSANDFIIRNKEFLEANSCKELKRLIHLLRVACKTMPQWLARIGYLQTSIMEPVGSAWEGTLNLVEQNIETLIKEDKKLVLGLVEDWSRSIKKNDTPPGIESAAKISFRLFEEFRGYGNSENEKRIFEIIPKVSLGDRKAFCELLSKAGSNDRENRAESEFGEFLLSDIHSAHIASEFPDELMQLTRNFIYESKEERDGNDGSDPRIYGRDLEVDHFFGFRKYRDFFPPSALRGPFFYLIKSHFKKGIDFVIEFANTAAKNYAQPPEYDKLEDPEELVLNLEDGTVLKQIHSDRLWRQYNNTHVGPYVLMCSLMALERGLLELGKDNSKHLDSWLLYILRKSNNSSLTAVITSVVNAYPKLCPETAKVLLSCREIVQTDIIMPVISMGHMKTYGLFRGASGAELFEKERRESDSLPHRFVNLENAALNLQLTSEREAVEKIIDGHLKNLPEESKQNYGDKTWRLSLHRMDMRSYTPAEPKTESHEAKGSKDEPKVKTQVTIPLIPKEPADDLKEFIKAEQPITDQNAKFAKLMTWSNSIWDYDGKDDPSTWREQLQVAMTIGKSSSGMGKMLWDNGPTMVATACARDHWEELSPEEKDWALNEIQNSIESSDSPEADYGRSSMSADNYGAFALSNIFCLEKDERRRDRAKRVLINSLFHAGAGVSNNAAAGVGVYLWKNDPSFALKILNAIIVQSADLDKKYHQELSKNWDEREEIDEIAHQSRSETRSKLEQNEFDEHFDFKLLDLEGPFAQQALRQLLHLISRHTPIELSKKFYFLIAEQIPAWWKAKREDKVPHELVFECMDNLAGFLLGLSAKEAEELCAPILQCLNSNPKECADFLRHLTNAAAKTKNKETYWALWTLFANQSKKSSWINHLESGYSYSTEMIAMLFLNISWRTGIKKWEIAEGFENKVIELFESLPPSAELINQLSTYLYHVGDVTLPAGFVALSKKLRDVKDLSGKRNCIYFLEQIMQRYVYGEPHKLKSREEIREAVIHILDVLVENGSSAAFKMRDDFVTPLSA